MDMAMQEQAAAAPSTEVSMVDTEEPMQVEKELLAAEASAPSNSQVPRPSISPSRSNLRGLMNPASSSAGPEVAPSDVEMMGDEMAVSADDGTEEPEASEGALNGHDDAGGEEEEEEAEEADAEAEADEDEEEDDEEEEEEDEEDEEEEEEGDSDSDGAESEDLELIITKISGPNGAPHLVVSEATQVVKVEQEDGDVTMIDSAAVVTASTTDDQPTAALAEEPAPNVLVPKKKKRPRSASPDEELPPPPPPMRTMRLERPLIPGERTIMWDILSEGQEKGMIPIVVKGLPVFATDIEGGIEALGGLPSKEKAPVETLGDLIAGTPEKLGESSKTPTLPLTEVDRERLEMEAIARRLEEQYDKPAAKKRKAKGADYDIHDEFIDDSELTIDRPTHYQRPKKEGFFVSQGPVELMEDPVATPKKKGNAMRKKRISLGGSKKPPVEQSSPMKGDGTRLSPIRLAESDDEAAVAKGKAEFEERQRNLPTPGPEDQVDVTMFRHASKDKALLPPFPNHHPRLVAAFRKLRQAALKETWADKKKFPEHIKPLLAEAAMVAIEIDCFDDSFFQCLPSLLPYNLFTLRKLSTKLSFEFHREFLDRRETKEMAEFKVEVEVLTPAFMEKHAESAAAYQAELEAWESGEAERARLLAENPRPYSTQTDTDLAALPNADEKAGESRPKEPSARMLFSPRLREIFWSLLENASAWAALMTQMHEYDPQAVAEHVKGFGQQFDLGKKKDLYRKLCALFPPGSMQTAILSREMSKLKSRNKTG